MGYTILKPVDADEIPDWQRRPPKWSDLVDAVLELPVGKGIPVIFDDEAIAKRARNAVRDAANLREGEISVRTRLVQNNDGTTTLFLTRVNPPKPKE